VIAMTKANDGSLRERWSSTPPWLRAGTLILGALEIVATTVAVVDLVRRPRTQVRGPKALWWAGLPVQPFGPLAYLALGRRPADD
jgi:hypothetical protein